MRIQFALPVLLLLCLAAAPASTTQSAPPTTQASVEVHFSPEEEIAPTIVKLIDSAQHSIDIAAFTFCHPDIAQAIIRAHNRGVQVQFVMDYTQSRLHTCLADDLISAGIEVRTRHRRGFQHNKYIVIDDQIVMTGSYNFSPSADERNTENLLVIRDAPTLVAGFVQDFELIKSDTIRKER